MSEIMIICVEDPSKPEGHTIINAKRWLVDEKLGIYYTYEGDDHCEFPKKRVIWVKFIEENEAKQNGENPKKQ